MIFWYLGFLVFIVIILLVEKVCWDKCNNLIIIIKGIENVILKIEYNLILKN